MKKLLAIVGIFIIIALGGYGGYMLRNIRPSIRPAVPSVMPTAPPRLNNPTPKSKPTATLTLVPSVRETSPGQKFTVNADLSTAARVYAVDLSIKYDPQAFTLLTVQPGTFFTNAQEFKKTMKQDSGDLLYSSGALSPGTGTRPLAILTFQVKTGNNKGAIMLTKNSLVATANAEPAVLTLSPVITIQIQNALP